MRNWRIGLVVCAAFVAGTAGVAEAQGIAVGPRLTFVRGDSDAPDGSTRFTGAALRLGSGKTALEVALDYRSSLNDDLSERIRDTPLQASALIFPVRGSFSPYLLGGLGWYSQRIQQLDASETVLTTTTTRKMGYHAGGGAEIRIGRRFGVYGDYRYTFIRFGGDEATGPTMADTRPGASPSQTPRLIPFAERLKLSHEGSMWSWGVNLYF